MHIIDPSSRMTVDQETLNFLRELTNSGVFKLQYDAWAFGVAYALKENLNPKELGSGLEKLPSLSVLPKETRFALEQATLVKHGETNENKLIEMLNGLAASGLMKIKDNLADLTVQERIDWVIRTAITES